MSVRSGGAKLKILCVERLMTVVKRCACRNCAAIFKEDQVIVRTDSWIGEEPGRKSNRRQVEHDQHVYSDRSILVFVIDDGPEGCLKVGVLLCEEFCDGECKSEKGARGGEFSPQALILSDIASYLGPSARLITS